MNAHWNVLLSWCFGTLVVSGTIWFKKNIDGYHGNNYYIMMRILCILNNVYIIYHSKQIKYVYEKLTIWN